jgi:tetratricopeptide (TPR) repeat protein
MAGEPRGALRRIATAATVALLATAAIVPRVASARGGGRLFDLGLEPTLVPRDAIVFVTENGLRERMYNDMEVGSYLAWEGAPHHRVFQDPRINGYPPAFHAKLRRDDLSRAEWETFLSGFGVTSALITYPDVNPRAAFFDPERWALVYRGHDGLVFVHRPEFDDLARRQEIPLTFAFDRATGPQPRPVETQPTASLMRDCEWQRRLGDIFTELRDDRRARAAYREALALAPACLDITAVDAARLGLGDVAMRLNDPAAAADVYNWVSPPRGFTRRAFALLALGRVQEALDEARRALAVVPNDADARLAERLARERLAKSAP